MVRTVGVASAWFMRSSSMAPGVCFGSTGARLCSDISPGTHALFDNSSYYLGEPQGPHSVINTILCGEARPCVVRCCVAAGFGVYEAALPSKTQRRFSDFMAHNSTVYHYWRLMKLLRQRGIYSKHLLLPGANVPSIPSKSSNRKRGKLF